jgi:hypothetical protein
MGRPPGRIQGRLFQMRVSDAFLQVLDRWRSKQPDGPSRAEAIRRLVMDASPSAPRHRKRPAAKAAELAAETIEGLTAKHSVPERARAKRRLIRGPREFRDIRGDQPKGRRR